MRLKKAFTLSEILVVLTVIGAISAMVVPIMTTGINDSLYKTSFSKAYSNVTNVVEQQKAKGVLISGSVAYLKQFMKDMTKIMDIEEYATIQGDGQEVWYTEKPTSSQIGTLLSYDGSKYGKGGTELEGNGADKDRWSPWMVASDKMAYSVMVADGTTCASKAEINSATSQGDLLKMACLVVAVDVNGLDKSPNTVEPQIIHSGDYVTLSEEDELESLKGDRYFIYIANDGVAKGNKFATVSGRIISGR